MHISRSSASMLIEPMYAFRGIPSIASYILQHRSFGGQLNCDDRQVARMLSQLAGLEHVHAMRPLSKLQRLY
jgi:hypothetical protein